MKKVQVGRVVHFGSKGYGFIEGNDGKRYFVHQQNIYHKSPLKVGTEVSFIIADDPKGPAAIKVKLNEEKLDHQKTINRIKVFLVLSYVFHLILFYILLT